MTRADAVLEAALDELDRGVEAETSGRGGRAGGRGRPRAAANRVQPRARLVPDGRPAPGALLTMQANRGPFEQVARLAGGTPGLYTVFLDDRPVYVGEGGNLRERLTGRLLHLSQLRVPDLSRYTVGVWTPADAADEQTRKRYETWLIGNYPQYFRHQKRYPTYRQSETEADAFTIANARFRVPAGHEVLTRTAAAGLSGITPADLGNLIAGNVRVDNEKLVNHVLDDQQRRHALRRTLCQPLRAALNEVRSTLQVLHHRALAAFGRGNRAEAFRWAGEACHLIQDSFSAAHTDRDFSAPGAPIRYIRYFRPFGDGMPREHGFFPNPGPWLRGGTLNPDDRDYIARGGRLTVEATRATRVTTQYLKLLLRHFGPGVSPSAATAALTAFMNTFLILSRSKTEPQTVYFRCRFL